VFLYVPIQTHSPSVHTHSNTTAKRNKKTRPFAGAKQAQNFKISDIIKDKQSSEHVRHLHWIVRVQLCAVKFFVAAGIAYPYSQSLRAGQFVVPTPGGGMQGEGCFLRTPSRLSPRANQPPVKWVPRLVPGDKATGSVTLPPTSI